MLHDQGENLPLLAKEATHESKPTWRTHIRLLLIALASILSSGVLMGFPTIQPLFITSGVFSQDCRTPATSTEPAQSCPSQDLALQNLYNVSWGITSGAYLIVGIIFDLLGARICSVVGAVGAAIGAIPIWAGLAFPAHVDWLLYPGFTVMQLAGQLNSFCVFGLLWHYPSNQAFILGVSQATNQLSGLAAYGLVGLAKLGLHLQWSFVILGGCSLVSAVICFAAVPKPAEFYARAKLALQVEVHEPNASPIKVVRDTISVMWQVKGATVLAFVCIGLPHMMMTYWTSIFANYLPLFITKEQSTNLKLLYTIALCVVGGGALPFLGILLDYIGMAWFYFILALTLSIFVTTLFIQNLVAQYCCLFFGVLYQACWGTYAQRWAVYFAPTRLIGAYMGLVVGVIGFASVIVNVAVPNALAHAFQGIAVYLWPLGILSAFSITCTVIVLVYLVRVGVPSLPPEPKATWCPQDESFGENAIN